MNIVAILMLVCDAGAIILTALAARHLARRGSVSPVQTGLALAAGAQLFAAATRLGAVVSAAMSWAWLLQTGCNLAFVYILWQTGHLLLALREVTTCEQAAQEPVLELPRIRAVATWPAQRRGRERQ